jgi:hypothetical protein
MISSSQMEQSATPENLNDPFVSCPSLTESLYESGVLHYYALELSWSEGNWQSECGQFKQSA